MKFILKSLNKLLNKSSTINRASINYKETKHIGILYKYVDENKQKALNDFAKKIKLDGKRVDFLPAISKRNADNRYLKTFRTSEINLLGKWSNSNVNLFIYQQYDFIIYPDLYLNNEMENILIRSHAKCRVGFIQNRLNLFELLLKSDNEYDINHRLMKLYSYIKKI
tara:strand:- start:843 stop:1343 length:501 start_codon:yes stop_codon:yes gene_type:complete